MFQALKYLKIVGLVLLFSFVVLMNANAQDGLIQKMIEPNKIEIVAGKSLVMKLPIPVKKKMRLSIGSPEIADCLVLSPNEIYIKGMTAGITNLILWQEDELIAIYDVEVKFDVSRLKEKFHQILPDEQDLMVAATNNSITLMGRVSNAVNLSHALTVAKAYAPEGKINNLLSVGGTHQVMLEVKIAEMSRSVGRDLGVNLGVLTEIGSTSVEIFSALTALSLPSVGGSFSGSSGDTSWNGLINALKENGAIKILAEPNLIALSGQTASFLAGGEIPYPISQDDGDGITIEFKDYGVGLSFTPNVLSQDNINIKVNSSVSEPDYSTATTVNLRTYPGISTRRASTTVELGDGQSFVIAGLLSETTRENVRKFPFLGDVPILGALFRSSSFQNKETELVVIVTPRLVKPVDKETQTAPTDYHTDLSDPEFYFNYERPLKETIDDGNMDDGNMDGQFGHSFEED